jgi:hypothetical protein
MTESESPCEFGREISSTHFIQASILGWKPENKLRTSDFSTGACQSWKGSAVNTRTQSRRTDLPSRKQYSRRGRLLQSCVSRSCYSVTAHGCSIKDGTSILAAAVLHESPSPGQIRKHPATKSLVSFIDPIGLWVRSQFSSRNEKTVASVVSSCLWRL